MSEAHSSDVLAELSTEEVAARLRAGALALLPIGATEAHGPHLSLDTDQVLSFGIAVEVAQRWRGEGGSALVLPTVPFGVTECAASFAGTLGVAPSTLAALLEDLAVRAAKQGFRGLVLVNSHLEPAHRGVLRAFAERSDLGLPALFPDVVRRRYAQRLGEEFASGACHAGHYETSLMLALAPERVDRRRMSQLADNPSSLSEAFAAGKTTFEEAGGPEAYFGWPARATIEEGRGLLRELAEIVLEEMRASGPWEGETCGGRRE